MEHAMKLKAKKAIDTLYDWLFDGPAYDPFNSASSATACVKNYESVSSSGGGADAGANGGMGGYFGGYAEKLQDKVAAVVSTASSVAANAAASYINGVAGNGAASGVGSTSSSHSQHIAGHASSTLASVGGRTSSSSSSGGESGHSLLSTLQSLTHPEFWQQLSPSSIMDRVVDEVHIRFGLNHWAEALNLEPHILLMLLLLPLFLLFLTTCLCMGAGHSSEEDRPHYPGQRNDPTRVGGTGNKQEQESFSSSKQGGGSSTTSPNAGKGGKSRQGSKKGGARDNAGSSGQQNGSSSHQYQLGNSNGVSSWAALLGSTGLLGAEAQSYKPIDIIAGFNQSTANKDQLTAKDGSGSAHGASGEVDESHPAQTLATESTQNSRHGSVVHGEGIVSTIMEDIVGQSDAQHEQTEIGKDNREEYVNEDTEATAAENDGNGSLDKAHRSSIDKSKSTKSDRSTSDRGDSPSWKPMAELHETNSDYLESHQHIFAPGTQQSQQESKRAGARPGAVGPGSDSLEFPAMRTRTPRARSFKEADRHRHQPHISSHARAFGKTEGSSPSSRGQHEQGSQQSGFASKMMDYAQGSPVWKNLDGISGGVLGATLATVAMLTNTVEATASTLKGNMPQTWADLSEELKDSFDEALNQGVEGSGIDQDEGWGFNRAIDQVTGSTHASSSSSSTTAQPSAISSTSARTKQSNADAHAPSKVSPSPRGGASEKNKETLSAVSTAQKDKASTKSSSTSAGSSRAPAKAVIPASKEPAIATNAPRLRQRSVAQGQPGLAIATTAAVVADSATPTPTPVSVSSDAEKSSASNAKSKPATASKIFTPTPIAASKSANQHKLSVEDISVSRPAPLLGQKVKANAQNEKSESESTTPTLASTSEKAKDNIAENINISQGPTHSSGLNLKEVVSKIDAVAVHNVAQSTASKTLPGSNAAASQGDKKGAHKNIDQSSTSSKQGAISGNRNKSEKTVSSNVSAPNKKRIPSASSKTVTVAAADASTTPSKDQKTSHEALAHIKTAAKEVNKTVDSAFNKADHGIQQAFKDTKHAAHDVSQALSKSKDSVAKKSDDTAKQAIETFLKVDKAARHAVHDAKAIADQIVVQAKEDLQSTIHAASKAKEAAVQDMRTISIQVDDATQQAAKEAQAIVGHAVDQGKFNVKTSVGSAKEVVAKSKAALHSSAQDAEKKVRSVQDTLGKTIHQAIETVDAAVGSAQKAKKNAITAVQSTVSSIEGTVSGAVQAVPKTVHAAETVVFNAAQKSSDVAAMSLHKSAHDAREAAEGAVAKARETLGSAVGAAQKAKKTIGSAVGAAQKTKDAVVFGAQETVKQAEFAAKSAAQGARKSVDGAIGSAYQAKNAAVQRASQAAQGAVHQARANVDSAVGAAKNVIVQNVVTPVRQAEQMIGSAVEIGRGTVEAAIQGAREASGKLEHDSKRAATKSSNAAKTAMDKALATAHKTEDHVAKSLKSAEAKAETTNQKKSHDAKSVLDTAFSKAHQTKESIAKNIKGATTEKSSSSATSFASGQPRGKDHGPSKKKASPTLDPDDYVYKNKGGDRVSEEEADDDSDEYDDDDDSKGAGRSSIFGSAPSILHQAKVAAGAIVARVADVGYENYDSAKHTFEDMVDNFTENIAGHEEPEENEQDDGEILSDSLSHVSTPSPKAHSAQTKASNPNTSVDALKKAASEASPKSLGRSSSPATTTRSSRSVFGTAQHAVSDATDSLADVADNLSEMITGAKSSVSKAMKEVKEIAAEAISRGNSPTQADAHVPNFAAISSPSALSDPSTTVVHSHITPASPAAAQSKTASGHQQTLQSSTKSFSDATKEESGAGSNGGYDSKVGGNKPNKKQNRKQNKSNHGKDSGTQFPVKKEVLKNTTPSSVPVHRETTLVSGNNAQESSSDSSLKDINLMAATYHIAAEIREDGHTYKPNLKSHHIDKDGFIIVEDPDLAQEAEKKNTSSYSSSVKQAEQHLTAQKKLQPKDPKHLHIDTPAVSRPESAASHRSSVSTVHHGTEYGLSYSGAVQLNVDENDHGALVGVSQVLISGPPQPLPHSQATPAHDHHHHDSLFSSEDFVVAPATHHGHHGHHHHDMAHSEEQEIGHMSKPLHSHSARHEPASEREKSLNPLMQHVIHPHDSHPLQSHNRGAVRTGAPATTMLSFEHGHAQLQGMIGKKGNKTKTKTKTKDDKHHNAQDLQQEFTVDQHGNKVPVVDAARRDSGFDLLM